VTYFEIDARRRHKNIKKGTDYKMINVFVLPTIQTLKISILNQTNFALDARRVDKNISQRTALYVD